MMGFQIKNLSVVNDIMQEGEIKLENTSSFDVKYNQESELTHAFLTERIEIDGHPEEYSVCLVVEGVFHVSGVKRISDKRTAHLKLYNDLFPYASHILSHLALDCGMPGLTIQKHPVELDEVHFGEKPQSGKIIEMK